MFTVLREKCRLNLLNRKIKEVCKKYDDDLKKAKENDDQNEIGELLALRNHDCEEYKLEIKEIKTRQLKNKAEKYCVKFPDYYSNKEKWEERYYPHYRILTEDAMLELRKAIREEERKEEQIGLQRWSVLISLLIGLGGIAVAIISLLLR